MVYAYVETSWCVHVGNCVNFLDDFSVLPELKVSAVREVISDDFLFSIRILLI